MQEKRRSFLKKTLGASALVATSGVIASEESVQGSNGVVIGKSPKKEILYKKTLNWEAYYKAAY